MIINRYHKSLSLSLACLLVLGMLFSSMPLSTHAADSKIQAGLPEIKSGHNNTLANTSVIAFGGKQWAVIGYNGSGAASASNTMTLLLADSQSFDMCQFSSASNQYNGSTLQATINGGGVLGSIPAKEQSLIVERTLTSADGVAGPDAANQKLWPLSYDEAVLVGTMGWLPENVLYYQTNQYWLRSPGTNVGMAAVLNSSANGYYIDGEGFAVTSTFYIRPALALNLVDVLFTSAATDGKPASVGSFLSIAKPITGAVKLTVQDND
ncbi:MAG: hypothetical protein GX153_12485, partial [Clostridiaceae bacterium]|nr:hypothetical protein [Clostridiaceae bacterium]